MVKVRQLTHKMVKVLLTLLSGRRVQMRAHNRAMQPAAQPRLVAREGLGTLAQLLLVP